MFDIFFFDIKILKLNTKYTFVDDTIYVTKAHE